MLPLALLAGLPVVVALVLLLVKKHIAFAYIIRVSSFMILGLSIAITWLYFDGGLVIDLSGFYWLNYAMLAIEIIIAYYIFYVSVKNKAYWVTFVDVIQIAAMVWFELTIGHDLHTSNTLVVDGLSMLMILIIGIIGSLICIYSIEYMKDYHRHHSEIKDRRSMFYATLFVFLSAMFGLVISNNLLFLYFFWEITTFCSFLLIGYTRTEEATKNAFKALTVNMGGGLAFSAAIIILGCNFQVMDFLSMVSIGEYSALLMIPVFLLAFAGMTKAAQMPFSDWLLGAMIAPTPTSAMLHSSTMVKAGVFLIIKLSPLLGHTVPGLTITLIGGITFFAAALIAVSQSDAKKVLAYSTISNLGLIVTCASIGTGEAIWAAIMLIVFHAVAKSLLFLAVGSTEHQLGSRNIEDMDGLLRISTNLTMFLIIGIAGMFLAPFGMLISKWAAMKAFIDSGNTFSVLLVAFGSSVTLFFWTKWMGKLIENANRTNPTGYIMRIDEKIPLYSFSALTVIMCVSFPLISGGFIIPFLNNSLHFNIVSPVNSADTTIIILMMCILFILPLLLIPLYRNNKVKQTSVYMSGQNAGDNESFYGSMGQINKVELRNWYMPKYFGEKIIASKSILVTISILVIGFCTTCALGVFLWI